MSAKIKKGDKVLVLSGRSKGAKGEVLKVFPRRALALVDQVNLVKRHTKPTRDKDGGILEKALPLPLCKLACLDPKDDKAVRVGFRTDEQGKKIRYAKRSGMEIKG